MWNRYSVRVEVRSCGIGTLVGKPWSWRWLGFPSRGRGWLYGRNRTDRKECLDLVYISIISHPFASFFPLNDRYLLFSKQHVQLVILIEFMNISKFTFFSKVYCMMTLLRQQTFPVRLSVSKPFTVNPTIRNNEEWTVFYLPDNN